jgi:6-phosphofructokinase
VAAVKLIQNGEFGKMVALKGDHIKSIPLATAVARKKTVDTEFCEIADIMIGGNRS